MAGAWAKPQVTGPDEFSAPTRGARHWRGKVEPRADSTRTELRRYLMPAIRVSLPESTPQLVTGEVTDGEMRAKLSDGELGTAVRMYHPGSESELQMFEVTVEPDAIIGQHAHDEDEIIYVLDGELRLGRQVLTSGASVYLPGMTLYSFRAGPEGLRFLNFRARQDLTYITKREFMTSRTRRDGATSST
jgi:Cupin domain